MDASTTRLLDCFARHRSLLAFLTFFLLIAGCRWQPKDRLVFEIEGKREYTYAYLMLPETEERREPLRLKFLDTNTFTTTASLAPGNYMLRLRTMDGYHVIQQVRIEPEKRHYKIPEITRSLSVTPATGPKLTGKIYLASGEMPSQIVILFIGLDIVIRRVAVVNWAFETEAPAPGRFRVEVHALGDPPKSWVRDQVQILENTDLGTISLR